IIYISSPTTLVFQGGRFGGKPRFFKKAWFPLTVPKSPSVLTPPVGPQCQKFWDGGPEETFFKKFSLGAGQTDTTLVSVQKNPGFNSVALRANLRVRVGVANPSYDPWQMLAANFPVLLLKLKKLSGIYHILNVSYSKPEFWRSLFSFAPL
ncbi:MAG: hypothetical protein LWY06_07895, partial [Firmicutes bacterium]|nr:hypothetical protein [Bacillota bacterium]